MSFVDIIAPTDSQEGTKMVVQGWMKEIGSSVTAYDAVVELETDKVTMEVEAPVDGVLVEILIEIGVEIEPGTVLGRLSTDVSKTISADTRTPEEEVTAEAVDLLSENVEQVNKPLSPSVRRFTIANNLDASQIVGTGRRGRVTLDDAKKYLAKAVATSSKEVDHIVNEPALKPQLSGSSKRINHTSMRRSIAKHMSDSVTTAPHVTAVFEADFTAISAHLSVNKPVFADQGVKLTYTAYMIAACVEAMKVVPEVNSQWYEDFVEVFSDINIGVGAALGDKGLVVPVIPKAQEKSLFGIAKSLQESVERARENKLKPDDVRGGTFTISNHGVSGSLFATPIIINQPQSAILGVGKLEKRVVVKSLDGQDTIAVRPMAYVSLTIDHRVLDGHQTNTWLSTFVDTLENWKIRKC